MHRSINECKAFLLSFFFSLFFIYSWWIGESNTFRSSWFGLISFEIVSNISCTVLHIITNGSRLVCFWAEEHSLSSSFVRSFRMLLLLIECKSVFNVLLSVSMCAFYSIDTILFLSLSWIEHYSYCLNHIQIKSYKMIFWYKCKV